MNLTFSSFAFGCRVNQAEKEVLDKQLLLTGLKYSDNNPDFFIINTCAVTNKAEREARQLIYQTKRKFPQTKIVVTGCAATKWIKEGNKVAGVDLVIDNVNKEFIAKLLFNQFSQIINREECQNSAGCRLGSGLQGIKGLTPINDNKFINSGRLLLKIQDGCQRFCTFCIVPYLRGQPQSERIKNLVLRIKNLEKSIKEVILTAINTQGFGYDTGEKLVDLIETILNKTAIERLSFGSVHPWSIDKEFLLLYKKLKDNQRFSKFLHIPLQSGSNRMLEYMKRGYTREEYMSKLKTIESIYPLTFIGTDIITGFLEETDKDFGDTYNFLSKSPISKFHVFRFSKRDKTAAYYMSKRLKEPTPTQKAKRSKALIELGKIKYHKFLEKHIGKTFLALFLERKIDGYREALLVNQIPILVKTSKNYAGEIKEVKVSGINQENLISDIANITPV